ncbi:MAG: ABC transporter permease [Planctomycetota bacterium]
MTAALRALFSYPVLLVQHWDLLWAFVWRELRARYEGSLLGRLWPILNPLILIAIYYTVFVQILDIKYEQAGVPDDALIQVLGFNMTQAMGLYLITGIVPWIMFAESIIRCASIVIEHANLIKKIAFPSELLVAYVVLLNAIYFLIALLLFLVFLVLLSGSIPIRAMLLPVPIVLQCIFTVGLGMFVGALNVFLRDTAQFTGLVVMLWMFLTPIFYPLVFVERKMGATAFAIFKLNPMYHLMEMYRGLLIFKNQPLPWQNALVFAAFALVAFAVGLLFYRGTKGRFADEV